MLQKLYDHRFQWSQVTWGHWNLSSFELSKMALSIHRITLKFKHNCFVSFIDVGIMLNLFETNALIMEAPAIWFAVEEHVDFY